jgi:hypothetical protein
MTTTRELTAARKADRAEMARQVADLAGEYRFAAHTTRELPGSRYTSVELAMPRGLRLTVKFDGRGTKADGPDVFVLNWHLNFAAIGEGARLHPGMFNHVNPYGGHKATDVAHGFDQLLRILRERFAVIRDGSAFVTEAKS